jgi:hypothetical protein
MPSHQERVKENYKDIIVHKYIVEIFMNETDSILLHDVLFVAFVSDICKITRLFDEPIFNLNEVHKIDIKLQKS